MIRGCRRVELAQELLELLREAQKHRSEHPGYVGSLPRWALYEQEQMLAAVNARRRTPVTLQDIQFAEQPAVGYQDYTKKFALYCADLVLEDPRCDD